MITSLTPLEKIVLLRKQYNYPIAVNGQNTSVTVYGHINNPAQWQIAVRYANGAEDILYMNETTGQCFTENKKLVGHAIAATPVIQKFITDHYSECTFS